LSLIIYRILSDSRIRYRSVGARLESGGRRDSSAKRLESERMPYARQGALLWGSLVSCGRLAIGQLPRLHGIAAVANRRAGCQPAPRHGSGSTFMSRTRARVLECSKWGHACGVAWQAARDPEGTPCTEIGRASCRERGLI